MSQPLPPPGYSPQHSFWPYYMTPPDELLRPARLAGWMLIAAGVVLLLGALAVGAAGVMMDQATFDQIEKNMREMNPQGPPITLQMMCTMAVVFAVVMGMIGLAGIILGVVARGGGRAGLICALVYSLLLGVVLLLGMLIQLANGLQAFLGGIVLCGFPLLILAATIFLLLSALRAAGDVERARLQMRYARQHQQMAAYQAYYQPPAAPDEGQSPQ